MASIEDRLLADISWREDELVILKTSYAQAAESTPRGRSLRRAYLALLYAHYEGFTKVAWEEYLIEISRCGLPIGALKPELCAIFTGKEIARVRQSPERDFKEAVFDFRVMLLDKVSATYSKKETSNLWPSVFNQMMTSMALDPAFISKNSVELKSLVGRRNDIAHGENVGISDSALVRLDLAVWDLFFDLTVCVVEACAKQAYRA